jgi:sugar lactone lactonase YvrE
VVTERAAPHDSLAERVIVAETLAGRHMAFTIEPDGSLTHRRVWAQPAPHPADPLNAFADLQYALDGVCIDADGCLWLRTP